MAFTFDDDERSTSRSRPIDLYTIVTTTVPYYLTSHETDVVFGGQTFTALTVSRGPIQVAQDLTGREVIVYLPITHALIQRYAATGIPEHSVFITIQRLQERSGQAQQQKSGYAQSISIDGHVAAIRVPSLTEDALKVRLPVIAASQTCNHVLYDPRCTMARFAFSTITNIIAISGTTVTVAAGGAGIAPYSQFGDILHTASGQRRMIISQTGDTLTLSVPLVGVNLGDSVVTAAGCNHDLGACRDKFDNVANFGGSPQLNPTLNPWLPGGLGLIQQT